MAKAYKSEALAAVHELIEGFHQGGAIDKQTMREFDETCLTTVEAMGLRISEPFANVKASPSPFSRATSTYLKVSSPIGSVV
jgi:putative transcriptional regulator